MNYRHIYHAGNFADIVKHLVLIAVLEQFKKKEKPFAVLDAFAGIGLYDLSSTAASKTLESDTGINKLLDSIVKSVGFNYKERGAKPIIIGETTSNDVSEFKSFDYIPVLLQTFFNIKNLAGENHYPGSPFIITKLLRPQDRLIACELHPSDYLSLKTLIPSNAHNIDAYNAIKAFLPFQEKRGLIFLDPLFEVKNEFQKLLTALKQIKSSALNNSVLIWYPIKDLSLVRDFYHNYKNIGFKETFIIEYELLYSDKNMVKCGLMLINPPNIRKELEELTEYLSNSLNLKFTYIDL